MNSGTRISRPDSSVGELGHAAAGRIAPHARLRRDHGQLDVWWKLQSDRVAVVLLDLDDDVVDEELAIVAEDVSSQGERLVAFLIHEVVAVAVGVQVRRRHDRQIGLLEFLPRLERPIEDRARQQIAHLQTNERLAPPGGRLRDLHVQTVVWCVLELEEHLSLDGDGFNQRCHCDLERIILGIVRQP